MSLEKNIERIADALEALAKAAGAKAPAEGRGATQPQAAQQVPGQPPIQPPPGAWTSQPPMQAPGQPQQMPQTPPGGQIPISLPGGSGMQWQGQNSGMATSGAPHTQQPGTSFQQPGIQPPPPAGAGTLPTTASTQQYTFDQLAVATANLASSGKDVFPILGRFGVNMLVDLPQEKFGEFAAALREAGAVI